MLVTTYITGLFLKRAATYDGRKSCCRRLIQISLKLSVLRAASWLSWVCINGQNILISDFLWYSAAHGRNTQTAKMWNVNWSLLKNSFVVYSAGDMPFLFRIPTDNRSSYRANKDQCIGYGVILFELHAGLFSFQMLCFRLEPNQDLPEHSRHFDWI